MEPKAQFGSNLRDLRNRKGWTQEFLAYEAMMDPAEVSRLERGSRDPGLGIIVRLADALDAPLLDLLARIRDPAPADGPASTLPDEGASTKPPSG